MMTKYDIAIYRSMLPKWMASGMLLLIYTLFFYQQNIHHLHHHHEVSVARHFDGCEQDQCHVTVYHKGLQSCDHKSHLSRLQPHCLECHQYFVQPFEPLEIEPLHPELTAHLALFIVQSTEGYKYPSTIEARGPPREIAII